jgi:hypothetical protein
MDTLFHPSHTPISAIPHVHDKLRHVTLKDETPAAFEQRTGLSIDDLMPLTTAEIANKMPRPKGVSGSYEALIAEQQAWKSAYDTLIRDQNAQLAAMQVRLDQMAQKEAAAETAAAAKAAADAATTPTK